MEQRMEEVLASYEGLRKRNHILKQAVLDYRDKEGRMQRRVEGLEEKVKELGVSLRRATEDNERLTFQNSKLESTCEVLQGNQGQGTQIGSKWFGSNQKGEAQRLRDELAILRSELETKIHENETLHRALDEIQSGNVDQLAKLQEEKSRLAEALGAAGEARKAVETEREGQILSLEGMIRDLEEDIASRDREHGEVAKEWQAAQEEMAGKLGKVEEELTRVERKCMWMLYDHQQHKPFHHLDIHLQDIEKVKQQASLQLLSLDHLHHCYSHLLTYFTLEEARNLIQSKSSLNSDALNQFAWELHQRSGEISSTLKSVLSTIDDMVQSLSKHQFIPPKSFVKCVDTSIRYLESCIAFRKVMISQFTILAKVEGLRAEDRVRNTSIASSLGRLNEQMERMLPLLVEANYPAILPVIILYVSHSKQFFMLYKQHLVQENQDEFILPSLSAVNLKLMDGVETYIEIITKALQQWRAYDCNIIYEAVVIRGVEVDPAHIQESQDLEMRQKVSDLSMRLLDGLDALPSHLLAGIAPVQTSENQARIQANVGGIQIGISTVSEEENKQHCQERLAFAEEQIKRADKKALEYRAEFREAIEATSKLKEDVKRWKAEAKEGGDEVARLKDTLESTRRNYESQIQLLTENLLAANARMEKRTRKR